MSTTAIGRAQATPTNKSGNTHDNQKSGAPNVGPMASALDHAVTSTIISCFEHLVVGL